MIEHFYESIPGWFDFQDVYREAVERGSDGAVFVEVGSWLGRSTAFMAVEIANSGKQIAFYAVDTWQGSPAAQYQSVIRELGGTAYEAFIKNMGQGGLFTGQHFHTMMYDSVEAAKTFRDGSLNFVFIDAAHDFHSVSRDVRAWLPKTRRYGGGVIAGHDANCPGLMNAVKQWIPARSVTYRGTSWQYQMGLDPIWANVEHGGVFDESLEEWAVPDMARRILNTGAGVDKVKRLLGEWISPPTPPDRYIAKWGGPPGEETFDFPYGVTTLDW